MRDIERVLRDSLKERGDSYEPRDPLVARVRFLEQVRRRRRMRFLQTGGALVATALLAALVVPQLVTRQQEPGLELASATPQVVATVPVGGRPTSAAVVGGSVWVSDTDGTAVVAIDPVTNELTGRVELGAGELTGAPDEIVGLEGSVWVSDTDGGIRRIDPESGMIDAEKSPGGGARVDLAAAAGSLWIAGGGALYHRGPSAEPFVSGDARDEADLGVGRVELGADASITDVAAGDSPFIHLLYRDDSETGLMAVDPETLEETGGRTTIELGGNADLAVGHGAVWVATGSAGTIERVDQRSGLVTNSLEIGGGYTDLTVGDDAVWAVTGGDGAARLYEIDPVSGELAGEPLVLEGDPVDVTTGAGAVWVVDQASGSVLRIERRA